jgi:hypothetical protein
MTNDIVLNITEITLHDGTVKFMPKGQREPDTIETLERDGLIRRTVDNDGTETGITLLAYYHPRVACWVVGVNLACREAGLPEYIPGYEGQLIRNVTNTKQ